MIETHPVQQDEILRRQTRAPIEQRRPDQWIKRRVADEQYRKREQTGHESWSKVLR